MLKKEKSVSIRELSGKKSNIRFSRPNSAIGNKRYFTIKTNNSSNSYYINQVPPPIVFTMPNNKKLTSGMGNNIEKEQLYENNMQLKESLNKIKRELAETKYNVVKKEIELREKEKILRDCLKENDLESVHESKMEKAKESALLTLCKEKYNALKINYQKEVQENKILRANIKITKIKEFQIENDILNKELLKFKALYENCKKNLQKNKDMVNDLNCMKDKFFEQHNIINSYKQKCDLLNAEIRNLKEERDNLLRDLENNIKKQEKLKIANDKLKVKKVKFLNQKKLKEEFDIKNSDNEMNMQKLKKEVNELKRAFNQKSADYHELKKVCDTLQKKLNNANEALLKPFQYKNIKFIEKETHTYNSNKIELYKSLFDESKMKNIIYEKYFKSKKINPNDIIKEYGFYGVLNTDTRHLLLNNNGNNSNEGKKEDENNEKIDNTQEEIKKDNSKEKIIQKKSKEDNDINLKQSGEKKVGNNYNNNDAIKEEDEIEINEKNEKEREKELISQVDPTNNDDIKTKFSEDTNTYTKANTIINNNNTNNANNNIYEEAKIEENDLNEADNNFLALIHLFLKNFEANHITPSIIDNKMKKIIEEFDGKTESSKEDFLLPFINLFLESMKVTQENDKLIVQSFLNEYIDYLNGNTNEFFNELIQIFENLLDYTSIENDENLLNSLALSLQKYKNELENKLNEENKKLKEKYIITFDIFRKIINDINLPLEDDLMEFLLYKMKSSVPENHSIFDLNSKIIIDLLNKDLNDLKEKLEENEKGKNNESENDNDNDDLSRKISDHLSNFKNNMSKDNTNLEKACKEKVQIINDKNNSYEIIEKDDFFEVMEKYGVTCNEEIKDTIYKLFIKEDPICTKNGQLKMMDFQKLKMLFLNDYYNE